MVLSDNERPKFIKLLRQPDATTFFVMVLLSTCQISLASSVSEISLGYMLKLFLLSAPISQLLYILSLEFASNLCFGHEYLDRMAAILGNLATGVPYAELLRFFEAEHRAFYNSKLHNDPNNPSPLEILNVRGAGLKLLYLGIYPLLFCHKLLFRHKISLTRFISWNVAFQALFNLAIWYMSGFSSLVFLFVSTYVGMSPLHPFATHLLLQHQRMNHSVPSALVYSYYGVFNMFLCNAGYHREKHLEPKVPWTRIHIIRQIYNQSELTSSTKLQGDTYYTSVLQALHDFIFLEDIHLQSKSEFLRQFLNQK